jgi:hypothetical protein
MSWAAYSFRATPQFQEYWTSAILPPISAVVGHKSQADDEIEIRNRVQRKPLGISRDQSDGVTMIFQVATTATRTSCGGGSVWKWKREQRRKTSVSVPSPHNARSGGTRRSRPFNRLPLWESRTQTTFHLPPPSSGRPLFHQFLRRGMLQSDAVVSFCPSLGLRDHRPRFPFPG